MNRIIAMSLTLAAASFGCSSSESKGTASVDKFLGTWTYTSGSITPACMGINVNMLDLKGQSFILAAGTASALIRMQSDCTIKVDVKDNVASAQPGQSCMVSVPVSSSLTIMATLTLDSWQLTTADGQTATTTGSGSVKGMYQTLLLSCPITETGVLVKGAATDGGGVDSTPADASAD